LLGSSSLFLGGVLSCHEVTGLGLILKQETPSCGSECTDKIRRDEQIDLILLFFPGIELTSFT